MQVHQFVHTLTYGDAISGEALAIKRLLRGLGIGSEIYSIHTHEKLVGQNRLWTSFQSDIAAAREQKEPVAVILHYSIGSPLNALFEQEPGICRALIYHNLTPEQWFFRYNARVVADLRQGRAELPLLLKSVDFALADSEFNRGELLSFGCKDAAVLPLLIDTDKWAVAANPGIRRAVLGHGGRNILHVGRFAPNKCIEDIIKAFYFYHHKIEEKSKLWLIGSDIDTEMYSFELRSLINELRLKDAVEIVGMVADSELKAFYEASDLYLCMSEHEGFCVPLIEAMYFGLPVLAFDSSAVGDTLGDGGLLLARKAPAETAELMNLMICDQALRGDLIARGKARVNVFNEERFVERLNRVLLEPLRAHSFSSPAAEPRTAQC
jgi:glycosyltransferase involved in cell wall biosynthesis